MGACMTHTEITAEEAIQSQATISNHEMPRLKKIANGNFKYVSFFFFARKFKDVSSTPKHMI